MRGDCCRKKYGSQGADNKRNMPQKLQTQPLPKQRARYRQICLGNHAVNRHYRPHRYAAHYRSRSKPSYAELADIRDKPADPRNEHNEKGKTKQTLCPPNRTAVIPRNDIHSEKRNDDRRGTCRQASCPLCKHFFQHDRLLLQYNKSPQQR